MAYGVFGSTNYGAPAVIHLQTSLWPEEAPGSGGGGNTRPTEGKMFPRGK